MLSNTNNYIYFKWLQVLLLNIKYSIQNIIHLHKVEWFDFMAYEPLLVI